MGKHLENREIPGNWLILGNTGKSQGKCRYFWNFIYITIIIFYNYLEYQNVKLFSIGFLNRI